MLENVTSKTWEGQRYKMGKRSRGLRDSESFSPSPPLPSLLLPLSLTFSVLVFSHLYSRRFVSLTATSSTAGADLSDFLGLSFKMQG